MVLFRCLAHAVLVPVLLAGCSQSLFGDGTGGGGDDPPGDPDAAPGTPDAAPGTPDAAPGTPDAASPVTDPDGGSDPDAGYEPPDAAPRESCPLPCAGDAFQNFYYPSSRPGRWRYVEIQPEQPGATHVEMAATFFGAVVGWQGTGTTPPNVALCAGAAPEGPCFELKGTLALTSPSNEPGAHHPAVMFIAPATGTYQLTGDWRVSSLAPGVETTMRFSRNSFLEVIQEANVVLTTEPYAFERVDIELEAGDVILLSATATTEQTVTVGVNLFVTGPL